MGTAIAVENLTFTHLGKGKPALIDIGLKIRAGHSVAVMGHSGSGKSSLCMCLNGLIPRFIKGEISGRVVIKGEDISKYAVAEMARLVGFVFQDFESQLISTNVELEVAFGPENFGIPRVELQRRVAKYLSLVRLGNLRDRQLASLSGGQKQRLAIASVLALETDIIVMDEPTTDLDITSQEEVQKIVKELARSNKTLMVVEHEPERVVEADQIVLMKDGRVVVHDSAQRVLPQVDLMVKCGIRPLQLVELFQQLGWSEYPLTIEDSLGLLGKARLTVQKRPPEVVRKLDRHILLETRKLSHVYRNGTTTALDNVDLKIQEGSFLAIIGKNGSGKTTLGKHLSGLLTSITGQVLIGGQRVETMSQSDLVQYVVYVFQNPDDQIFGSTVYEEVAFGPRNFGLSKEEIESQVTRALNAVGLEGYEMFDPFTLTKGERQRVAVASVLTSRPKILILDEPTTGLDYRQQRSMMEMLTVLNNQGHTIIIITHSMWIVTEYTKRTIVMNNGRIILDGPTRNIFTREDTLAKAGLKPPLIVQLSNRLGAGALSVNEMLQALSSY